MKNLLKSGMYTSLGLAANTLAKANDVIDNYAKSLKEREFEGQIIFGILKGKGLEFFNKNSEKLLLNTYAMDEMANMNQFNFSLSDLNELWEA